MANPPAVTAVVCAAAPAPRAHRLVDLARARGWAVEVVATPAAVAFLDLPAFEALAGGPVRVVHRPAPVRPAPPDAVVVAPATYNTVCKLALGVSDNYALGSVAEAIGRGLPVAVLPFVHSAFAARAPFRAAVESLRAEGVRVVFGPGRWQPHPPGTGDGRVDSFPWAAALDAAGVVARGSS
ncbi:flavoprotein [Phytohabitans sp. ZYX-F-186]|uniref:Flavoprotein n=1 Tax=Phytohabitans maris TaxID=3071409 RepID=A0ABU0ZU23_9ACTN|nr:flavoprotein [Phytohabitans sp. ZYX-F-186]MDQ7910448.1 flavoprotein [Phytohabitans sp. ZYX-F-186]